jgi:imidazolonepropionase-like amidohydrolase
MLLIKNATLYTMDAIGVLEAGDILIQEGRIAQIGTDLVAEGARVIDATGLSATPGLIDAHSHAGGFDTHSQQSDVNEGTNPITPQLNIIHSIDVQDASFQQSHRVGVTTVCVAPGSANVIGGMAVSLKTYGRHIFDMVLQNPAAMKCALGGSPKGYGRRNQTPMTRMAVAALLRDTLRKAVSYQKKQLEATSDQERPYDAQCEALLPVLRRQIPLKTHCEQFDMRTIIEIAKEFNLRYTIDHGWAGDLFLEELYEGGGPVLFGPIGIVEGVGELTGGDVAVAKALDERGISVSLITDAPVFSSGALLISAGEAVRVGVPHQRALAMITINPAKALGLEHRLGSLTPGKDADIVLFAGVPALETNATVKYNIIDGEIVYQAE